MRKRTCCLLALQQVKMQTTTEIKHANDICSNRQSCFEHVNLANVIALLIGANTHNKLCNSNYVLLGREAGDAQIVELQHAYKPLGQDWARRNVLPTLIEGTMSIKVFRTAKPKCWKLSGKTSSMSTESCPTAATNAK